MRTEIFALNERCSEIFANYLAESKAAAPAREYLAKRGVSQAIVSTFRLGYAPAVESVGWNFLGGQLKGREVDLAVKAGLLGKKESGGTYDRFRDRILFPIYDISGRICGFGGRIVGEGQPKYLNSPESEVFDKSNLLLGLYQQKEAIRQADRAILVEGNFDLISLVGNEVRNVAAPLGTALTREQLRLLKRFTTNVTLLFDGDEAGAKAAERAVSLFLAEQIPGQVVLLPDKHDPDTYVRQYGKKGLERLLAQGESLPEFLLGRLIARYGLNLDGKSKIVEELQPLVKAAASPLQRSLFISHFAGKLDMAAEELKSYLAKDPPRTEIKIVPKAVDKKNRENVAPLSMAQRQLVEYMIMYPRFLSKLEDAGIRDYMEGSIGEIIFLQYRDLLGKNSNAEPEELLPLLPDGAERQLVADLLLRAHMQNDPENEEGARQQFQDALQFLQKKKLQKQADELLSRIRAAESAGNDALVAELMMEQVAVTQKMHEVR